MFARLRPLAIMTLSAVLAALLLVPSVHGDDLPRQLLVYFGTYTSGESEGIYCYRMDYKTGALTPLGVTKAVNPSFLALNKSGTHLYAVGEIGNYKGRKAGSVSAFAIEGDDGKLRLLNTQSSVGAGPCHLVVGGAGKHVLVANYGGGSAAVLPIKQDGSLDEVFSFKQHHGRSVNKARQERPHAHSINVDANNRFAFVADLGLDKIMIYRYDDKVGQLRRSDPPFGYVEPGGGPRHFAFHPSGRFAYTNLELTSQVTAYAFHNERGVLRPLETESTLPDGFEGNNSTAEIQVHPSGKFVYCSNRGHNSIAIFAVDPKSGRLEPRGQQSTLGKTPRNFGIDPHGRFLIAANQSSSNVVVFRIDQQTGQLKPTGVDVKVPNAVCVKFR